MGEKLGVEEIENVIRAALILRKTFTWSTSTKGQEYWRDVFEEFIRIAETGEP